VLIFQKFIDEADYSIEEYMNEKELISLVEKEVSKLPKKMREVFELSRNAGLSHREIADKLNL
jgi:RNA polymerase sigma-70 factor (ECF subfamily)